MEPYAIADVTMHYTRDKSKRKIKRDLAVEGRKRGACEWSQLGRTNVESKRQAAVAVSSYGLMRPRAQRGFSECVDKKLILK